MKRRDISRLKRRVEQIEQEGYVQGCWIEPYKPAGTARGENVYFQLRSRELLPHGKKSKHLRPDELAHYQHLIVNGRELRKLKRDIAWLEKLTRAPRATLTASASDEWYTPPVYIEMAREVMGGIDLDPASNETAQQWIQAARWYGLKDDGLKQRWQGRVWLNPPYGNQMQGWIDKTIEAYASGEVCQAVLLVRPAPGSRWYQALTKRFAACATDKRIRFIDKDGKQQKSPVHGNMFFYAGSEIGRFKEVFSAIGVVSRPM